ncbi:MAG: nucleoside deaminase, partial [Lactobacillus johnsonii]|nr:nucleoside deaminase [Lactobacillus johnsonii]
MLTKEQKEKYMHLAFEQAKKAEEQGEVPIGAVVVDKDGNVIGEGYNRRELDEDATQHAEMIAIRQACKNLNSWRLVDCSLFITLEPCPMCSGAIINSRLAEVYYGAFDPKAGAASSVIDLFKVEKFNHHPKIYG